MKMHEKSEIVTMSTMTMYLMTAKTAIMTTGGYQDLITKYDEIVQKIFLVFF